MSAALPALWQDHDIKASIPSQTLNPVNVSSAGGRTLDGCCPGVDFCCPPNRQQTQAHHIYHSKLGVCADHLRRGTIVGLDDTRLGVLRVGRLLG
jgi:hypothetical protein